MSNQYDTAGNILSTTHPRCSCNLTAGCNLCRLKWSNTTLKPINQDEEDTISEEAKKEFYRKTFGQNII